jgi:hypothetical protein
MITSTMSDDRVRRNTADELNQKIDDEFESLVRLYAQADRGLIDRRIEELDREWDMERTLEANASSLALAGTVLGVLVSRKWLVIPLVVTGFLLNHAVRGWCPPVPAFRRLGVRTRQEIERERYALMALRGDFGGDLRNPDSVLGSLNS